MTKSNFNAALKHVLSAEGGLSQHPADRGGTTKYGITVGTLAAYRGEAVNAHDVVNLTQAEAEAIYRARYWDAPGINQLVSPVVSLIVFDQAVNAGPSVAVRTLQSVLRTWEPLLEVDGLLGPKTTQAANAAPETKLALKLVQEIQRRYLDLCQSSPSQRVFLRGWMARTWKLLDYCYEETV